MLNGERPKRPMMRVDNELMAKTWRDLASGYLFVESLER